jgi:cell division initiation protein
MIDLTPLDVRKKHEDFKRIMRGFDPQEVQVFLELVSERMEELVRENIQLRERSDSLQQQVDSQTGREQAVQDALVTAQELRSDIKSQAHRGAEVVLAEAQTEARRLVNEAEAEVRSMLRDAQRKLDQGGDALEEMERRRGRFLKGFRQLLEREFDVVEVEEGREPLENRPIDLDLGGGKRSGPEAVVDHVADHVADVAHQVSELFGESADDAPPADLAAVDESAAERPPLDASVEDLAAAYGDEAGESPKEEDTLFLSLDEPDKPSV